MISRADGPSNVNTQPTNDAASRTAREAEPTAVLPPPDYVSGDPIAMMAKLFVKSAQQKRESDGLAATTEEHAEDAADAKRIEAMKDRADKTLVAGMVGGISQVASGTCSITSGAMAASDLSAGHLECAKYVSEQWEGAGGLASGGGKIGEALLKHMADGADRDITKAESESKVAKRAQDALHKEIDAATQHEGKVIQLLQEIKQAQAQCEHAVLLRV